MTAEQEMAANSGPAPPGGFFALGLLTVFGILAAVALGEIFFRLAPPAQRPKPQVVAAEHRNLPRLKQSVFILGAPNTEGLLPSNAYFRTNSAGFRGPETSPRAGPGVFRIAILGDSVTMGSGVSNDETYSVHLARMLNEGSDSTRFEVLNFGLAGLSARQVVQQGSRFIPPFAPDLLIYGWTANDIEGPAYQHRSSKATRKAMHKRRQSHAQSRSYLLRALWPRAIVLWDRLTAPRGTYLEEIRFNYLSNDRAWKDFATALADIVHFGEDHNAPVVVFLHAQLSFLNILHPYHAIYDKVATAATQLGAPTIQSIDAVTGYDGASLWVSQFDPHPNPLGHEIFATALLNGLRDLPKGYLPRR